MIRREYARSNLRVLAWVKRLLGDPAARPTDLSEEELALVIEEVAHRNGDDLQTTALREALIKTSPVVGAPDWTDDGTDLGHVFAQPEMRAFWRRLLPPKTARGPKANWPGAKAAFAFQAMTGTSAHVDSNHKTLAKDAASLAVFKELQQWSSTLLAADGGDPPAPLTVPSYKTLCRLLPRLAPNVWPLALETNVAMMKELRKLHPEVGRRLIIDCCSVPAWAPQHGAGDPNDPRHVLREAKLRRFTPEAGFVIHRYTSNGKTVAPYEKRRNGKPVGYEKRWRGYLLAVIVDNATGLPLVWTLYDASLGEQIALTMLLSDLHRLWPDIDAELIAGDSIWDTNECNRLCEVHYGIAPIFRLHPSDAAKRAWIRLDEDVPRDDEVGDVEAVGF